MTTLSSALVPSLRLLDDHLFPVKYTDSFYRRLLSDGYFVVVAVAPSGEVVAVASARTVRYEDGGPNPTNDAYIMTLGVRDTFRRHRLGTKALQLLILRLGFAAQLLPAPGPGVQWTAGPQRAQSE